MSRKFQFLFPLFPHAGISACISCNYFIFITAITDLNIKLSINRNRVFDLDTNLN